jgi:hypothetical protein
MLKSIKTRAFEALTSKTGNVLPPVRWSKRLALYINDNVGRPLASDADLAERDELERIIAQKRAAKAAGDEVVVERVAAPVIVFHTDKTKTTLHKLTDILDARDIPYELRSLEGDKAGLSAHERDGGGHGLPCVYIAGDPIGGREQVANMDQRGELMKKVYA